MSDTAKAAFFKRPRVMGALIALLVLAADQISKYWLIHVFDIGARGPIQLAPMLDLVLAWNPGISYSLLSADGPMGRLGLLALASIALIILSIWFWRTHDCLTAVALGLVIGGAIGNAIDRWNYGAVADFFYLHTSLPVGPLANYVFNIADVGIVAGAGVLLYESLMARKT